MIEVTCAIILLDEKILVTQRSEKMSLPLKWEFPGGKIEQNETARNCIIREIKEELNIEIELIQRLNDNTYNYKDYTITLIPFIANFKSGDILLNEHKDFKWLEREELLPLDWAPADIAVVENFLKEDYGQIRSLRTTD